MKTTVDNLSKAITNVLDEYKGAVITNVDEAIKVTSEEAVSELKQANPTGSGQYGSWKKYNKSWTIAKNTVDKRKGRGATIHNKKYYRLTHLLENGHALPQGGRSKAYKHIQPVEEKATENFYKRLKEGL